MKKTIKLISILSSLILFVFMMIASQGGDPEDASETTKGVTIDLGHGYIGTCAKFFESEKNLDVTITIDSYTGSGTFQSNFATYRKRVTNNMDVKSNYIFEEILVPESGSFLLTVTVDGLSCFDCCPGTSCTFGGKPFFRGLTPLMNTSETPSTIYITPLLANCF